MEKIESNEDQDRKWINKFLLDLNKVFALKKLNDNNFFNPYERILDLGAGPLYTTNLLSTLNPEKNFIAADYSEEIISVAKSIKMLRHIPYHQVDVLEDREGGVEIPEADLTICVNFEYHFNDEHLSRIFIKLYLNSSDLLIITHTIGTPKIFQVNV